MDHGMDVGNSILIVCSRHFPLPITSARRVTTIGSVMQRWRTLLDEYRVAVRREILRCQGIEIDTAGDGFFVRFETPGNAIDCARAALSSGRRLGLETRTGIHTGECEMQGRGLTGIGVHIGARIQGVAAPGEILVSATVRDLAAG